MILTGFFKWWYLEGWRAEISRILDRIRWINDRLSTKILLKTLIKPWKQTVTGAQSGVSLQIKFQDWAGNQISRLVGLMIRGTLIFISLISSIVLFFYGIVVVIAWPLIPPMVIVLPILAVVLR